MDKFEHSFDPYTNIVTQRGFVDDKMVTRSEADLSVNLEYSNSLRNDADYARQGIKKGWMHAIHVPAVKVMELAQIGIDVYTASPREIAAGLNALNSENFLTTTKNL